MYYLIQRYQLINILLIVLCGTYLSMAQEPLEDVLNVSWILAIVLFFIIPQYYYRRKYLLSVLLLTTVLLVGVVLMEMVIEGDGEAAALLDWWTWSHEFPGIFWPVFIVSLIKIGIELTIRQHLMINLEKERLESEVKFLQSQLSPHVLFNNLNNIYSFALHRSEHTPKLILKLADIMRYMLYETKEPLVPLSEELDYLDNYIELQLLQLENRGEVVVEKHGDPRDKSIAPMMLISFVENCFKHAAAGSIADLRIIIHVEVTEHEINLYTENSYIKTKLEEQDQLQEGGIGLRNAKKRLALLYPSRHELIIKALANRYIVNLTIDLKKTT